MLKSWICVNALDALIPFHKIVSPLPSEPNDRNKIQEINLKAFMVMMASPASKSTSQLRLLVYAGCCFLFLSRDAPRHAAAADDYPLSFNFNFSDKSAYSSEDIRVEGSAVLQRNVADLTCDQYGKSIRDCVGWMWYKHPVQFYDNGTNEVATFVTRFTFAISLPNDVDGTARKRGDGMAFFLSSYPPRKPVGKSLGSNLGLHTGNGAGVFGTSWFVAVEFDTFHSPSFDPDGNDHIGIDINTVMGSVNTTSLPEFSLNGTMTATVSFNSSSRMLVASVQFDDQPSLPTADVSIQLTDLVTSLLPSEVAVGFSAATGDSVELHQILSWSFNSTLPPLSSPTSRCEGIFFHFSSTSSNP
jgi:hypothetical protein